ncbi:hypothetical protein H8356DRAFT_1423077 [Neocallimastix lanati (nom. inval.)]|nr:hypothetical protein H8356DRAFT_1423077 [Neocallimastix sp. JGI-2020a]
MFIYSYFFNKDKYKSMTTLAIGQLISDKLYIGCIRIQQSAPMPYHFGVDALTNFVPLVFLTKGFYRIWWLGLQRTTSIRVHDFMCPYRYILLNCNLSDNYAFSRELVILVSLQREITNSRRTRRSSTSKILSNNMYVRAPTLKHSVKSCSRDNSAFIKTEVCDYLNIPTALEGS